MRNVIDKYEVGVLRNGQVDMLYFDRRHPWQAAQEGGRHGKVEYCRKVDTERIIGFGSIEKLQLNQAPYRVKKSPYRNAISMDENIWNKRNKRRKYLVEEKNSLDNKKII